jgi:hypothetical protein
MCADRRRGGWGNHHSWGQHQQQRRSCPSGTALVGLGRLLSGDAHDISLPDELTRGAGGPGIGHHRVISQRSCQAALTEMPGSLATGARGLSKDRR